MTPKQMYRAMRRWGISIVKAGPSWYAGECVAYNSSRALTVDSTHAGSIHLGNTMEEAVEDYCNARNLEWDV